MPSVFQPRVSPEWEFANPYNRGFGILPLVMGAVSAVGGVASSFFQSKAASKAAAAQEAVAQAQIDIARIQAKTARRLMVQNIYSDPAERGKTIFLAGIAGLALVAIVGLKRS